MTFKKNLKKFLGGLILGSSKAVGILFLVFLSAIVLGGWYMVWNQEVVQRIIDKYWVSGTPFLDLMLTGWNVIPIVIVILVVITVIATGMIIRQRRVVMQ
jgi:hypothetical protein